jgi:hypothetical protein
MKSDQELQADVLAELKWDPRVHGNEIGVIAKDPRAGDEGIAERIARLITWSSMLRNTSALAEVRSGYVTLTGEAEYPYQKQLVADRVAELDGVSGISNNIKLREAPADVHARDVVRQIMRALHRHASIEASNIHVSVANANVTLEGTIPTSRVGRGGGLGGGRRQDDRGSPESRLRRYSPALRR